MNDRYSNSNKDLVVVVVFKGPTFTMETCSHYNCSLSNEHVYIINCKLKQDLDTMCSGMLGV